MPTRLHTQPAPKQRRALWYSRSRWCGRRANACDSPPKRGADTNPLPRAFGLAAVARFGVIATVAKWLDLDVGYQTRLNHTAPRPRAGGRHPALVGSEAGRAVSTGPRSRTSNLRCWYPFAAHCSQGAHPQLNIDHTSHAAHIPLFCGCASVATIATAADNEDRNRSRLRSPARQSGGRGLPRRVSRRPARRASPSGRASLFDQLAARRARRPGEGRFRSRIADLKGIFP